MVHMSHPLASPLGSEYAMITPQYSPKTTVAISFRIFEKEAKTQAEQEYDATRGVVPADDDDSIDIMERPILKKKRKVRSAIVSRNKNAIYEKKLEDALHRHDLTKAQLNAELSLMRDVLRNIHTKICEVRKTVSARKNAPKRMRPPVITQQHQIHHSQVHHQQIQHQQIQHQQAHHQQAHHLSQAMGHGMPHTVVQPIHREPQDNVFFLGDDPINDVLTMVTQESRPLPPMTKPMSLYKDTDFTSECSDGQMSPMLQPQRADAYHNQDLNNGFGIEDSSWKNYMPQHPQASTSHLFATAFAE